MREALCIALIGAALAGSANAGEAGGARLARITGSVLVSNDWNIASANEALRLTPGMRVLVTQGSSVVVEYDDGCRVKAYGGERLEIRPDRPCAARAVAPSARTNLARS